MKIERVWAMPNKWTFKIKPIANLLSEKMTGYWIDPFAGKNSPATLTNDLNPSMPVKFHLDALIFLKKLNNEIADGVIFDPPYSFYELRRCYKSIGKDNYRWGELNNYWSKCKDEIARIIKNGGKCISFGWNSTGIGKKRGFKITRILLVCHGSIRNDTIVTIETKGR